MIGEGDALTEAMAMEEEAESKIMTMTIEGKIVKEATIVLMMIGAIVVIEDRAITYQKEEGEKMTMSIAMKVAMTEGKIVKESMRVLMMIDAIVVIEDCMVAHQKEEDEKTTMSTAIKAASAK